MYPNLTDEEKYSIRQFIKKYEEENGWNEVLHANKETDDYPNYIPNAVFNIYHMISVEPDHPNYKAKQFMRAISKMDPNKARILRDIIEEYQIYILSKSGVRYDDRKAKKPVKKVKRCRCKK